ncbi:hypothetical protein BIY26_07130 [Brenneria goodwinii]|uniref:Uncharacterized protein n=1 Tax=Brenneria goodwinii TaxID=1109412 RepID=A0AAE8EPP6_9GAMM|nr:hypothetical protein [Brenneria goodwinii]ATA26775.1 hypothetical protein AWC36_23215 [Brenneria goodwinii]RLM26765.1 hypothetical protein BIY26_07130 [Brenneria goodwinii]
MKVSELQKLLAACDQDATVLIAGFETTASLFVAEADLVTQCKSVPQPESSMSGNRSISLDGDSSIWIGWSKDYRTESFLDAIKNPEKYS